MGKDSLFRELENHTIKLLIFQVVFYVWNSNKNLILGKVGFQSNQITAASWSGNSCQPSNQLIITLIRLLSVWNSTRIEINILVKGKWVTSDSR